MCYLFTYGQHSWPGYAFRDKLHFLSIWSFFPFLPKVWLTTEMAKSLWEAEKYVNQTSYQRERERSKCGRAYKHSPKPGLRGFPGGTVVGSLPASAGDVGSSPGLGGSHVPRSNWACGPQLLGLCVWSLCSATGEATIVRGPRAAMGSGPRLPQLGRALAQRRRPNIAINQSINQSINL